MLKQLMIQKKIAQRQSLIAEFLESKKSNASKRSELENAIEEATTEDELTVIEESVTALDNDEKEISDKITALQAEITGLESELDELNSKQVKTSAIQSTKGDDVRMANFRFFHGRSRDDVENIVSRSEVKDFMAQTRALIGEQRTVSGKELLIPVVMMDILRDTLHRYSKLIKHVNLKPVKGKARQTIAGSIPEGVWMEACGKLNELNLVFNQLEVDGYKVGGFIAICNANLEDSDVDLADEIMDALGQAIGLAVDKAILYGTGAKMLVGIVKRLSEAAKPAYWGENEKTWTDLRTSNLLVSDPEATSDVEFYKDLVKKLGKVKSNYSNGVKFWAMSSQTFANLQARALTINAAGAIVSGQTKTMPIVGGDIVELDFIPENIIIGGYGSLYLLAERKGTSLAVSEHAQFIEDNTVFKGTARYDGRPVFGEAFVAINISQEELAAVPSATAVTFAADTANG